MECPICLDVFTDEHPAFKLDCEHEYHKNCIIQVAQIGDKKCPLCRRPLTIDIPIQPLQISTSQSEEPEGNRIIVKFLKSIFFLSFIIFLLAMTTIIIYSITRNFNKSEMFSSGH